MLGISEIGRPPNITVETVVDKPSEDTSKTE
jgi:hypothetical protein